MEGGRQGLVKKRSRTAFFPCCGMERIREDTMNCLSALPSMHNHTRIHIDLPLPPSFLTLFSADHNLGSLLYISSLPTKLWKFAPLLCGFTFDGFRFVMCFTVVDLAICVCSGLKS